MKKILCTILSIISLSTFSQTLGTDVVIDPATSTNQQEVKITSAPSGWMYSVFTTSVNSTTTGYKVMRSKNGGQTWTLLYNNSVTGIKYTKLDIVANGTDTNSVKVFVATVSQNASSNYVLSVDRYDGKTGSFEGSPYLDYNSTRPFPDVAISTDLKHTAIGASPYSIAIVYSKRAALFSRDSVIFAASLNGGTTFTVRNKIQTSLTTALRNVAISYGYAPSKANRYFVAWEDIATSSSATGTIYTAYITGNTMASGWSTPYCIDCAYTGNDYTNYYDNNRNPSIAVLNSNNNNDSSDVTALVLFESAYNNTSDFDIIGAVNSKGASSTNWRFASIDNATTSSTKQPSIVYNYNLDEFGLTYFDETSKKLIYKTTDKNYKIGINTISPNYNNASNITIPSPQLCINNVSYGKPIFAWVADGIGSNGVAMFDTDNLDVSVYEHGQNVVSKAYPNPASDIIHIVYTTTQKQNTLLEIYNTMGSKVVEVKGEETSTGLTFDVNVSTLSDGIYFYKLDGTSATKFVVKR